MQQYEYIVTLISQQYTDEQQQQLDTLGKNGWRLVAANHDYLYFERPLKEKNDSK